MKRSSIFVLLLAIALPYLSSAQENYFLTESYRALRAGFHQAIQGQVRAGIYASYTAFLVTTDLDPRVSNPAPNTTETEFKERAPKAPRTLADQLPPRFRELYGKSPTRGDPNDVAGAANCWNTALAFNEPERNLQFTSPYEMVMALNRNYRLVTAPLEKGDVISMWNRSGDDFVLEHSAVFLSGRWLFGKQTSFAVGDPYLITSFGIQFVNYDTHLRAAINTNKSLGDRGVPAKHYVYSVHRLK